MGSVGDDYRFPWCRKTGRSGYSPDPIGYPICCHGESSCLWKWVRDASTSPETIIRDQLYLIFKSKLNSRSVLTVIAQFY